MVSVTLCPFLNFASLYVMHISGILIYLFLSQAFRLGTSRVSDLCISSHLPPQTTYCTLCISYTLHLFCFLCYLASWRSHCYHLDTSNISLKFVIYHPPIVHLVSWYQINLQTVQQQSYHFLLKGLRSLPVSK